MKQILLPEIVSVGIYNAQLAYKGRAVTPNRKTTMFELELPIGRGGRSHIDDESHAISERIVICAKPGQVRHTRPPFRCYYVHMIVNEGQIFDILSSLPNYLELDRREEILEIFSALCEHYGTGTSRDDLLMQSLILKLVYLLDRQAPVRKIKQSPKHNNREVIGETLSYIGENLTACLTLEALAERASFSPVYFHKLFKSSTGKNLHDYVEEQRIKRAIDLLISTEMTLAQIAYDCGFSSQSYFSYAFKRRMKCSPREYAASILQDYEKSAFPSF